MTNIYVIKNKINDVVYIGQTKFPIYKRFCEHIVASYKKRVTKSLYVMMKELGQENFYIELLETCEDDEANLRENYYIDNTNNCNDVHNFPLSKEELEKLMKSMSTRDICKKYNIRDKRVVLYWCRKYGICSKKERIPYEVAPELSKNLLYEEYVINNKSIREIQRTYNLKSKNTVQQRLRKFGITK